MSDTPDKKGGVSRREFIKGGAGALTAAVASPGGAEESVKPAHRPMNADFPFGDYDVGSRVVDRPRSLPSFDRRGVLLAMGETFIPSAPGDPGYRDLEWYGITAEVDRRLPDLSDEDLRRFDGSSEATLGKRFTALSAGERADHFRAILEAEPPLRALYDRVREIVMTVYYQNFPEHRWPLDAHRKPLLRPGDTHQTTNPNSSEIPTGWDHAGYAGPLTWEEEERRRRHFQKIRWEE